MIYELLFQVMDGNPINVDVTAPGAIIALALMYLKVLLWIYQKWMSNMFDHTPYNCTYLVKECICQECNKQGNFVFFQGNSFI